MFFLYIYIYITNKGRHKLSAKCKLEKEQISNIPSANCSTHVRLVSSVTVLHINDLVKVKAAFMLC